jgi:hypothetical protein
LLVEAAVQQQLGQPMQPHYKCIDVEPAHGMPNKEDMAIRSIKKGSKKIGVDMVEDIELRKETRKIWQSDKKGKQEDRSSYGRRY